MSNEFLRPSAAMDKIANESVSFEDMREYMKVELEKQGIITRNVREDGNYGAQLNPGYRSAEPAPESSMPEAPARETCVRRIYPHGNDTFTIFGASEQELDSKEKTIREMYRV